MIERITVWALRLLWFSLPYSAGALFVDALAGRSSGFGSVAATGLWLGWGAGLLAVLIPHIVSLTALRILAPAASAAALWAFAVEGGTTTALLGLVATGTITVFAMSAPIGAAFVNGTAYGDEHRLLLRPSSRLLLGPIPLAWVAVVAGIGSGPLLLGASQWWIGGAATMAGFPLTVIGTRALHGLARRWLVFVPAGLVVHDVSVLADPQLFRRVDIDRIGPALSDTEAVDLTAAAPGLAIEIAFVTPMRIVERPRRGEPVDDGFDVRGLLVTPSQPGAALSEAEKHRIPVG